MNIQLNLNTVLLSICVGLSGWALKSIEDLKVAVSNQGIRITNNGAAIIGIDNVLSESYKKTDELEHRITILETIQLNPPKSKN